MALKCRRSDGPHLVQQPTSDAHRTRDVELVVSVRAEYCGPQRYADGGSAPTIMKTRRSGRRVLPVMLRIRIAEVCRSRVLINDAAVSAREIRPRPREPAGAIRDVGIDRPPGRRAAERAGGNRNRRDRHRREDFSAGYCVAGSYKDRFHLPQRSDRRWPPRTEKTDPLRSSLRRRILPP